MKMETKAVHAGRRVDLATGAVTPPIHLSTTFERDAVRKRIARSSLESSREDGHVLVWLDDGGTEAGREAQVDGGDLVEDLREQVHYLRSILTEERDARRRADTIIAQLTQANAALAQRVPELEASPHPPGGPESVFDEPQMAEPRSATGALRRAHTPGPGGVDCSKDE